MTEDTVRRVTVVESSSSWDGAALPSYPQDAPRVTILRITIPPGAKLEMHRHPVINAGIVLRGELTVVTADGVSKLFGPGEGVVEMVHTPHYGENRGPEAVELVMFYAGTTDTPLSQK